MADGDVASRLTLLAPERRSSAGNLVKNYAGTVRRKPDSCHTRKDWRAFLPAFKPAVVVVMFGGQDVYDMSWDNGKTWTWAGKPAFDKRYLATMSNASTGLQQQGPACCPVNFKTRPDGVHFSRAGADAMMPKLGPVIRKALAS